MKFFYGKKADIRKLKEGFFRNPESFLKHVRERQKLFENPSHLEAVNACYICGGKDLFPVMDMKVAVYYQCQKCRHVFINKRIRDSVLADFYRTNKFYSQSTYANQELQEQRREQIARPKVDFVFQHLPSKKTISWLDVGAGAGDILACVKARGAHRVAGIELSKSSCEFAEKFYGLNLISMPFKEFSKTNTERFDVISFFGVLEHLPDPMEAVTTAREMLTDGGLLIVEVPHYDSLSTRIQSAFPGHTIRHAEPFGHMMLFTQPSLEQMFLLTGYKAEACWFFGMDIYEMIFQFCMLDKSLVTSDFIAQWFEKMEHLQSLVDQARLSDFILMIARKN